MIRFLVKGLLRDRHRSLFPVLVVATGVFLTVLLHCWLIGVLGDMIDTNARFATGHVKVVTRAYAEAIDQKPNDLALTDLSELVARLRHDHPDMDWVARIHFGGLLDVPDAAGETKAQAPVAGLAVDLRSPGSTEPARLNIDQALRRGQLPSKRGQVLLSAELAGKLGVGPGDGVTLLSSTMYGSMAMQNFTVAGTVAFGVAAMDRGAMIMDVADAQAAFDMRDAAGELLGYAPRRFYDPRHAARVAEQFNAVRAQETDEFAPVMLRLEDQNELGGMLEYVDQMAGFMIAVFVLAMSIVLWNSGLIGGIRRYGEIGLRLAIGESKGRVYRTMLWESVLVGLVGSVVGALIGLGFAWWLQVKGFDTSGLLKNVTMMAPTVFRARITPVAYFIGFVPGVFSTVLGTLLAGIGIYRRQTAQLFKELEA